LDVPRLMVACSSLLASIPEEKRSGRSMASAALSEVIYKQSANNTMCSPLRQKKYLNHVLSLLKSKNEVLISSYLKELNQVREKLLLSLFNGSGGRVRIAADFNDSTEQFLPQLHCLFPVHYLEAPLGGGGNSLNGKVKLGHEQLIHNFDESSSSASSNKKGLIVGLSSIENSSVYLVGKGVEWTNKDEAKLMVAIEYLTALEGNEKK
jgi:Zn-dependent M16 (insulinase) family peptidase